MTTQMKLEKHSKPIPLLGGIYLIFNILIIYIINFFYNFIDKNIDINFLFFFSILIFVLGILDDKFDLKVRLKFFLLFTIIFCLVSINENILINNLYFETFQTTIFLGKYSTFFTVLCFLLFLNACNMFDGINLQLGIYSLQVFIFFIFNNIFFHLYFNHYVHFFIFKIK